MSRGTVAIPVLLFACGPAADPSASGPTCASAGSDRAGLVSALVFARIDDEGISPGFNLDGEVSTANDPDGCYIADYVSPDGLPGIDNGFGSLLPILELTEFAAVEGLIAQAIANGALLLTVEVLRVDDLEEDACVDLRLGRAAGTPMLGTDGTLESGQTLARDPKAPGVLFEDLPLQDGRVVAGPLTLDIPITVFDVDLNLTLQDGAIQVDLAEDGTFEGVISGGVDGAAIEEIASTENVDPDLVGLMSSLLASASDLHPQDDGACTHISAGFSFSGIPAWFFED